MKTILAIVGFITVLGGVTTYLAERASPSPKAMSLCTTDITCDALDTKEFCEFYWEAPCIKVWLPVTKEHAPDWRMK
jgi:hypothetical protein